MRYQNPKSSLSDLKLFGSDFMKIQDVNLPFISSTSSPLPKKSFPSNISHQMSLLSQTPTASKTTQSQSPYLSPTFKHNFLPNPIEYPHTLSNSILPLEQINRIEQQLRKKYTTTNKVSKSLTKVQKLRNKISIIKQLNEQKHKDILDLYNKNSKDLVADFQVNKKIVSKIKLFNYEKEQKKIRTKERRNQNEEFLNKFYNSIERGSQKETEDYKERLVEIQNTLKNNHIPRKVEEFLVARNIRVPKFLKQLKY